MGWLTSPIFPERGILVQGASPDFVGRSIVLIGTMFENVDCSSKAAEGSLG